MKCGKSILCSLLLLLSASFSQAQKNFPRLKISSNGHFFMTNDGDPFFWMGETGWLLFSKLDRQEADMYLENRRQKGFNVIQVMGIHSLTVQNVYGRNALVDGNLRNPAATPGSDFNDTTQYDYWDHVDYIIDKAEEKGLYLAIVPVWGSGLKSNTTGDDAKVYTTFLANRYKNKPNIIWLNGGDVPGSRYTPVWDSIGSTLRQLDTNHLITYHPRGRTQSSTWFHNEKWLDFNMFQSGHRRYDQDTSKGELHYGEDNWKYVKVDYNKKPTKPTLDGEPSYEEIPQGLHDSTEIYWTDKDVRRYGYWSVFAGGAGFTYGHNSVIQMYKPTDKTKAYGAKSYWYDAINYPGAAQMIYLKKLMLSRPYFERVPAQDVVVDQGEKYNYIIATKGENYAFIYTYNGRNFKLKMGSIAGSKVKVTWYNPRNGEQTSGGVINNKGIANFNPPGEQENGNDWVLILDTKTN
jgi:hypothetical protein